MENFIKAILESNAECESEKGRIRVLNHIDTSSGYELSVQCSEYHYCTPRKTLEIKDYNEFELAIFKDDKFVYPDILKDFNRKDELDECYEGTVFEYVPKDLVEDLYNYLNNHN